MVADVCVEKGSFISSISGGQISGVCDQFVGGLLDFVSSSQNMPRRGRSGHGRFTSLFFAILLSMLLRVMAGSGVDVFGSMGFLNCMRQWTTLERNGQAVPECVRVVKMADKGVKREGLT